MSKRFVFKKRKKEKCPNCGNKDYHWSSMHLAPNGDKRYSCSECGVREYNGGIIGAEKRMYEKLQEKLGPNQIVTPPKDSRSIGGVFVRETR